MNTPAADPKTSRQKRIEARNRHIQKRFYHLVAKRKYRIDYLLQRLSLETGLHPEYIRQIVKLPS
jgi:hypothetical protein